MTCDIEKRVNEIEEKIDTLEKSITQLYEYTVKLQDDIIIISKYIRTLQIATITLQENIMEQKQPPK